MSSKKPRKKYNPKGVIIDTMAWVQAGMKKVEAIGAGTTLKIRNYDAMNNLRMGIATRRDVDGIIDAINMAEALCRRGIGEDWLPEINDAQAAAAIQKKSCSEVLRQPRRAPPFL